MKLLKAGGLIINDNKVKICMSTSARDAGELSSELDYAAKSACDIVEIRYDYWKEKTSALEYMLGEAGRILRGKPILFTYRSRYEGGLGTDGAEEYRAINTKAILSGRVDILDIEFSKGELASELIASARENGVKTVVSKHLFDRSLGRSAVIETMLEMQESGGDIVKFAAKVSEEREAREMISAARELYEKRARMPFVMIGMGEHGKATRRLEPFYGSVMTYVRGLRETAPGQFSISELL